MLKKDELDELIWLILHGWPRGFETCRSIQQAATSSDNNNVDIDGLTAIEACVLRTDVIVRIAQELKNENLLLDHVCRLFHALTIFKVEKRDTRFVPSDRSSYVYQAAYSLWALDDNEGEEGAYAHIISAAWYVAEMMKG